MSKEELLRIYSAYLPYGLSFSSSMDKPFDEFGKQRVWTLNGISEMFGDYCLLTKENSDAYAYQTCKPQLWSLDMLTQPIEHKGKIVTPIIELLDKASLYDLSNCEFEINIEDEEIYIDAYNGGRLVDAMFYNGNIFKMNGNTKYYPPQIDLNELMLELHLNVFNLPDSAYIKKENLKK